VTTLHTIATGAASIPCPVSAGSLPSPPRLTTSIGPQAGPWAEVDRQDIFYARIGRIPRAGPLVDRTGPRLALAAFAGADSCLNRHLHWQAIRPNSGLPGIAKISSVAAGTE
jgi:hypothetical protein